MKDNSKLEMIFENMAQADILEERKISDNSVEAFLAFTSFKNSNTEVKVTKDPATSQISSELILHDNKIAKKVNEDIFVTLAGWPTMTTMSRLNAIPGVHVSIKRGQPHLNGVPWDGEWKKV